MWEDPWIRSNSPMRLQQQPGNPLPHMRVCDLMVPPQKEEDTVIWGPNAKGDYTSEMPINCDKKLGMMTLFRPTTMPGMSFGSLMFPQIEGLCLANVPKLLARKDEI